MKKIQKKVRAEETRQALLGMDMSKLSLEDKRKLAMVMLKLEPPPEWRPANKARYEQRVTAELNRLEREALLQLLTEEEDD